MASTQGNTEIQLTQVSLVVTAVASALLAWSLGAVAWNALTEGLLRELLEAMLFGALAGFLVYGNLCYQVARIGQLKRAYTHRDSWSESSPPFNHNWAPALTVLVPSYNEEISIIRQTLLSAALQI